VEQGFQYDMSALRECDAVVMVQPCGRSAALELGWACGSGKATIVLLAEGEPELMLKMADHFCLSVEEVVVALEGIASASQQ
jgi:nucleoside 2-deoxyribosyltransferase